MRRGAFRPHPYLQQHIDGLVASSAAADTENGQASTRPTNKDNAAALSSSKYMALHARVEPDSMQSHTSCKEKKVIRLLESQFPDKPPADKLFIAISAIDL
jgi:hypothetical protein